jgi:hypothetical protein
MYSLNAITKLEELINKVQAERFELVKSNNLKLQDVFDGRFNYFKEFTIKVTGESAYFHAKDEEGINKELFTIYFYERYSEERKLELSYYTTNTQSEFEVERLISLGKVARILRDNREFILKDINQVINSDLERSNQLYRIQDGYEKEKRSYQKANDEKRRAEIEFSLKGDGVVFASAKEMTLKRNYFPRVLRMKIVEVSKSGKTCTVQYTTRDGFQTVEENCSTENIISQVNSYSKDIVQELLPA